MNRRALAAAFGFGLILMVGTDSWPVALVSANHETAPSLIWSVDFSGFTASGVAGFAFNTFERESGGSDRCQSGRYAVDVDWVTGDVWVGWSSGDASEAAKTQAHLYKLRGSTGATSGSSTDTAAFDVGICGVALDQRGRLFAQYGPWGATKFVDPKVWRTSDFSLLTTISHTLFGASDAAIAPHGVKVDVLTDQLSSINTRVLFFSSFGAASRLRNLFTPTAEDAFTQTCTGTPAAMNDATFRKDGTSVAAFWDADNAADVNRANAATCGTVSVFSDTNVDFMLDWYNDVVAVHPQGATNFWEMHTLDDDDVSTPIANTAYTLAHHDATKNPTEILGLSIDADGDIIICGVSTGTQPTDSIFKASNDFTTIHWKIELDATTRDVFGCKLGANGEVIVWGRDPSVADVFVSKYCCNDVGVFRAGVTTLPQIDEADNEAAVSGGIFDDAGPNIGAALGTAAFGGNLFLGGITILMMTVGGGGAMATISRDGRIILIGAGIGAFVGFIMAWGFGFFSDVAVFSLVILAILILVGVFFARRGGG